MSVLDNICIQAVHGLAISVARRMRRNFTGLSSMTLFISMNLEGGLSV